MTDILEQLAEVLEQRKQAEPGSSYVASLYGKELDAIIYIYGSFVLYCIV